jgi:hypothetical protein
MSTAEWVCWAGHFFIEDLVKPLNKLNGLLNRQQPAIGDEAAEDTEDEDECWEDGCVPCPAPPRPAPPCPALPRPALPCPALALIISMFRCSCHRDGEQRARFHGH